MACFTKISNLSENFDSGYGHDSNRNSVSIWHYNQQDRFVMKVSQIQGENTNVSALQLILPMLVRYYEQKYV